MVTGRCFADPPDNSGLGRNPQKPQINARPQTGSADRGIVNISRSGGMLLVFNHQENPVKGKQRFTHNCGKLEDNFPARAKKSVGKKPNKRRK